MDHIGAGCEAVEPADLAESTVTPYLAQVDSNTSIQDSMSCTLDDLVITADADLLPASVASYLTNDRTFLRAAEVIILLVADINTGKGRNAFSYADVIDFSYNHMEKPFSEASTFKHVNSLVDLKLVTRLGGIHRTSAGRPRELFEITESGTTALRLAVLLAMHLAPAQLKDAA